jgi:hypothetical protein
MNTDFFDTHKAQCAYLASKLRAMPEAASFVAALDASVSACDAAIAAGRLREDMPSSEALAQIRALYDALLPQVLADLKAAILADQPNDPHATDTQSIDRAGLGPMKGNA